MEHRISEGCESVCTQQFFCNQKRHLIFGVLLLSCVICSFLQTALTTLLPVIMEQFQVTASVGQWLTSVYSLTMGIMIPATPFLMKRFSTKKLFLTSMGIFTLGLLLSGAAASFSMLMAGRILQALGCGVLLSLVQVVVLTIYPPENRGTMMGFYGLAVSAVPVIAPSFAGIIADHLGWNAIFLGAIVVSVVNLIAGALFLENISKLDAQRFDILSMLQCSIGFSGILISVGNLGTYPFLSLHVLVPFFIGTTALVLFIRKQLCSKEPLLELRIFQNRAFRLSVICSMLLYAVMMAGTTLIPIYIQTIRQNSATVSGLLMLPGSLVMAVTNPFAGKIYDRLGIRKLFLIGSMGMFFSCVKLSFLSDSTTLSLIAILFTLRSFSIACVMMPMVTWGMSTLDSTYAAHGTAIITTLRTIAGAVSTAIFVSIMTAAGADSMIKGIRFAMLGVSALAGVQCVIALFIFLRSDVD